MLKVLSGHTSPETAYVVDDYPYGFRLRCKIRYWLEFSPKHGFRLCSQTTDPKIQGREVWNRPNKSTYRSLAVMGLDAIGHVTWEGLSAYELERLEEFGTRFSSGFDPSQSRVYEAYRAAIERHKARLAAEAVAFSEPSVMPHPKVLHGQCPTCHHYGEDCVGQEGGA